MSQRIMPLLAGVNPDIVGAALAELFAMLLAGYQGDGAEEFRRCLLDNHVKTVKELLQVHDARLKRMMAQQQEITH